MAEHESNSKEILAALNSATARWLKCVRGPRESSAHDRDEQFRRLMEVSLGFTDSSIDNHQLAYDTYASIMRGIALIRTALEWDAPVVGKAETDSAKYRGLQWRLVIAWSGTEQIVKRLCHSTGHDDVQALVATLPLAEFAPLDPPPETLVGLRRYRDREGGEEGSGINEFLQAESRESKRRLRHWLIEGNAITTWPSALMLAKVFRHISAHGALSATKVREWGLAPALERLVPTMGTLVSAVVERMAAECPDDCASGSSEPVERHNRALSLMQPHAEAVMRSRVSVVIQCAPTNIFGRVFLYASSSKLSPEEEQIHLEAYGIALDSSKPLRRGLVLGTVELYRCIQVGDSYEWHFREPNRWRYPKLPDTTARGKWFTPFNHRRA